MTASTPGEGPSTDSRVQEQVDKVRLDYEHTAAYFHSLAEIRFKLLALLPLSTGTAIVVLDEGSPPHLVLAVGILGALASFGLLAYDQRNTELYDRMQRRAKILEAKLGFERFFDDRDKTDPRLKDTDVKLVGGAFLDRPRRGRHFLGIPLWHDFGVSIVYAATLAGWTYLIASASGLLLGTPNEQFSFGTATLVAGITFFAIMIHDDPTDEEHSLPVRFREVVWGRSTKLGLTRRVAPLPYVCSGTAVGIGVALMLPNPELTKTLLGAFAGVLMGLGVWVLVHLRTKKSSDRPRSFFVAAKAWVRRDGKTLLLLDENQAWDLPGGRIGALEFGRRPFHEVLERELKEELGLEADAGAIIGVSQWTRAARRGESSNPQIFVVHFEVSAPPEFEPKLSAEHSSFEWSSEPHELLPRDLLPEPLAGK